MAPRGGIDHSGRKQKGRASYYAQHFTNRKMADGHRFDPNSNVAASKSLPLGTTAKVTNLNNGKSALVKVQDRGPYIDGRVVDLTPKVADQLDMKKAGVTPVVVAPVAVPQADGAVKLGAGAPDANPQEVEQATQEAAARHRGNDTPLPTPSAGENSLIPAPAASLQHPSRHRVELRHKLRIAHVARGDDRVVERPVAAGGAQLARPADLRHHPLNQGARLVGVVQQHPHHGLHRDVVVVGMPASRRCGPSSPSRCASAGCSSRATPPISCRRPVRRASTSPPATCITSRRR